MSSGPEYKASESVNLGCCRLCKSVGDTGNLGEIFTAKPESTTSGGGRGAFIRRRTSTMLPLCEFLPRLLCRPRERRPKNLESPGPRFLKVRYHLS